MSNFIAKIKHPETGKIVGAVFIDNYFGEHKYGVKIEGEVVVRKLFGDYLKLCEDYKNKKV